MAATWLGMRQVSLVATFILSINLAFLAKAEEKSLPSGDPLVEDAVQVINVDGVAPYSNQSLRVGFYNIEMFTDGIKDGKNRTEAMALNQAKGAAPIIAEVNADILLISEIENGRILSQLNDALAKPYPAGYIVQFGTGSGQNEKMNIGMLSRYPVESAREIDFGTLTGVHKPTRGLFRVVAQLDDKNYLLLYAAHLKANWGERERNYAQRTNAMNMLKADVKRMVEQYPDRSWEMMLIGDFNTDPLLKDFQDDPTLKVLEDWIDLFSQHPDISNLYTVPTRHGDPTREFPPALFDRVLVNPSLMQKPWQASLPGVIMKGTETEDTLVLPGQGKHVSDHFPVYIDLIR